MKNLFCTVIVAIFTTLCCQGVAAQNLKLPKPTGKYEVGTKAIELKDTSRIMLRDSTSHRWMVQAYYPVDRGSEGIYPYMPDTLENGGIRGIKVLANSKPNAELSKQDTFPVIFFIPGLGGERQKYSIICEDLASHGYVVFSLDLPYISNFVRFPDGTKIMNTLKDVWKVNRDRDYRYHYYDEAMEASIEDIKFMLNHFDEINNDFFAGRLVKALIAVMGHSFGGNVAHTFGFQDLRIKAVIDIDSKITERQIYGRVGVPPNLQGKPVLFIRGMMQYQDDEKGQLTKISNAKVQKFNVQHSAFSDNAFLVKYIDSLAQEGWIAKSYNWIFKKGPFFDSIDTNIGNQDVAEWFQKYRSTIIIWLDQHLKKDTLES